jgi:hypothetical protein
VGISGVSQSITLLKLTHIGTLELLSHSSPNGGDWHINCQDPVKLTKVFKQNIYNKEIMKKPALHLSPNPTHLTPITNPTNLPSQ